MTQPDYLAMTTSDVIYSADYLDTIAVQAATERRALAVELAGQTAAWQADGRPGFLAFVDAVHRQSQRIHQEVGDVADKLRIAVREYSATAEQGAEMLSYHRGGPSLP